MNSCLLEYATAFGFLFWFSSAILLSRMKWIFLNLYISLQWARHYFSYLLSWCTNLQTKRTPLMKLSRTIWMYGGSEFQNNNIKKDPTHFYYYWNCLSRKLLLIRLIIITLFYCRKIYEKISKQYIIIPQHNPLLSANQNPTIMITQK